MPQASDELRAKMQEYFNDPVDDQGPMAFLKSQGYTLRRDYHWDAPEHVKDYGDMTEKEFHCLLFLVHEWDMGGLARTTTNHEDPFDAH